jgi:hypothetical protein
MELSTTGQPAICIATRQFPSILWNQMFHCRIHKITSLFPILSQTKTVHTILVSIPGQVVWDL